MQLHKLTCSYISLHTVTWACMQLHKLACSCMSLHAVPWACMQFPELACSYLSLHAVSFFVWAAHKNFAVLVYCFIVCYHLNLILNTRGSSESWESLKGGLVYWTPLLSLQKQLCKLTTDLQIPISLLTNTLQTPDKHYEELWPQRFMSLPLSVISVH